MLRLFSIFPVALSITAFVLSLLVLISGRDTGFLQDVFVIKIDTSDISTTTPINTLLANAGINTPPQLSQILDNISNSSLSSVLNTAAHELGLFDIYTAHTITWCSGALTSNNHTMYTRCSRPAIPFSFNPVKILEDDLLQGLTLQELGFPTTDVNNVINTLEMAYRAMSACYLVGVILAGLTIVTGLLGLYVSRLTETVSWMLATLGSTCLVIASVIGTILATRVVDVINQKAKDINVVADRSTKYLGMTWAAVGALLIVTIVWMAVCCCGTHRSNRDPKAMWNRRRY